VSRKPKKPGSVKTLSLQELAHSAIHEATLERLNKQLLIVLINRLGGKVDITVQELDGTGQFLLGYCVEVPERPTGVMRLDAAISGVFKFEVRKKQ
jgi:hypothetical protein